MLLKDCRIFRLKFSLAEVIMAITVLKIRALPKPIEDEKWVQIEYTCAKCGEWGVLHVTDIKWREMVDEPILSYLCAKWGGRGRNGRQKLNQMKHSFFGHS